ncbi:hypothetical protein [Sphingobium fluviale]|jgi:hypothetical protein|uniref:DUF2335 domain-containing protein n=1 Tax=Sphingobium fluviale TaxID=2506423 RepID=A0A4Q1KNG2_9SPHN|nr:hypothetical protein [Sphingobium fluviale]RXR30759.1 hypothetical protein EQG66_00155 [Sphingobium fluviale]
MTDDILLNGSHSIRPCPFAERRRDETLHDFLLRRHQEMGDEITTFEAITRRQAAIIWDEREARIAHECSLLVSQAWIAAVVAGLFGIFRPDDWLGLVIAVAVASMIGGICLIRLPSALRRALDRIRGWRRK